MAEYWYYFSKYTHNILIMCIFTLKGINAREESAKQYNSPKDLCYKCAKIIRNRFETFYDAILAIIITILVLKIPQPLSPNWGPFFSNYLNFTTYFIVFLSIINIWYSNQNLFQHIDDINNKSLVAYGISIFLFSLFPYFASWLSLNVYSLTAETIFGLLILFASISHIISVVVVFGANKSNEKLKELNRVMKGLETTKLFGTGGDKIRNRTRPCPRP